MSEKDRQEKMKRILEVLTHIEDIPDTIIDILYGMLCS